MHDCCMQRPHWRDYSAFRLMAENLPLFPFCTSNETCWFSANVDRPARSTAEMCTNTSFEPSCGVMNPKPLVALKNFTVPVVDMNFPFMRGALGAALRTASSDRSEKVNGRTRKRMRRELADKQSTGGVWVLRDKMASRLYRRRRLAPNGSFSRW